MYHRTGVKSRNPDAGKENIYYIYCRYLAPGAETGRKGEKGHGGSLEKDIKKEGERPPKKQKIH